MEGLFKKTAGKIAAALQFKRESLQREEILRFKEQISGILERQNSGKRSILGHHE